MSRKIEINDALLILMIQEEFLAKEIMSRLGYTTSEFKVAYANALMNDQGSGHAKQY